MESNPATRIVWNSVKPMLMGQIIYAPDSPAVRQIIRNVSSINHLVDVVVHVIVLCSVTCYSCLVTLWGYLQTRFVYIFFVQKNCRISYVVCRITNPKGVSTEKQCFGDKKNNLIPSLNAFCYSMTSMFLIYFSGSKPIPVNNTFSLKRRSTFLMSCQALCV